MLTDREREVVGLVAEGLNNTEIAERLVVSPATAKTHVSRIMSKLGARDRAQLVVLAYQSGLIQPPAARPEIVDAYSVCPAALLVTGGPLGDWYGGKWAYLAGLAAFTPASAGCPAGSGIDALTGRARRAGR